MDAAFQRVERSVAEGEIPGAVALVAHGGNILREAAFDLSDVDRDIAFQPDTICWATSMKAITAAAVMKLVEDGKLSLEDPVEKYLPEFAGRENFNGPKRPPAVSIPAGGADGFGWHATAEPARAQRNRQEGSPL